MIGARVGNWYVDAELGRGPGGVVYRARDYHDPDRTAAVKVLTGVSARDPGFLQRFPAEMLALQRLDHPNVARFFDCGTHGGVAFFACELVEGTDGGTLLEAGRRPWREVLSVAVQAVRALKHGHNRNLLHRDLKPAHFILTRDGTLKLLGFGLARVVPPELDAGRVLGSAAYLPPETTSGKAPTRRSDFYSLGGVLYTLLTGRPPFAAPTLVELTHKQCYALPERPGMLVRDLPPELDEFVCGLLEKNPGRRPASAQNLLDELERIRGKLERKGEKLDWPAKLVPDTAEMAALPASLAGPAKEVTDEPGRRPLLKRPAVVVPLFLLALLAVVLPFAWPRPSAEELWNAAAPLVESDNPTDWDRAWTDYLDPLERRYPERFQNEVAAAKARIRDRKELRRIVAEGAKLEPRSDAERGYLRGLRLAQAGDAAGAREAWRAVATAFGPVESESRWVKLSQLGFAVLDQPGSHPPHATDRRAFDEALAAAKLLAASGRAAEAEAVFRALEELCRDDVDALAAVRAARGK